LSLHNSKLRLAQQATYKAGPKKLLYARDETYVSCVPVFPMNLSHVWLKYNK